MECFRPWFQVGKMASLLIVIVSANQGASALELPVTRPVLDCAALARTDVLPGGGEPPARISFARVVTADTVAPYCEVRGYVASQVRFELRLPTQNWNQRFLFSGCGGFCGRVEMRYRAADGCAAVENGEFASVTSDLGHDSPDGNADTVWASGSPEARANYGYRAVHVVTVTAKAIIARFYRQPARFAYFSGCSDGGREGPMEVQRYPDDFDGVVAGAPVIHNTLNNTIFHAWSAQRSRRADGSLMFEPQHLARLHDAVLNACDTVGDGVQDGVVGDPSTCRFYPATLLCGALPAADCLTQEQVDAARAIYSGPLSPAGKPLYYGRSPGSELMWGGPEVAGYARSFISHMTTPEPQTFDLGDVRYDTKALAIYNSQASVFNATDPDIGRFLGSGRKLILWHGWGDPGVPPMSTVSYYEAVRHEVGPELASGVRLYMLPGVGHCGGGEGPDKLNLIDPIMAWVEDGVAPGAIEATRKVYGRTRQVRTVYPFPATRGHDGKGDPNAASTIRSSGTESRNSP